MNQLYAPLYAHKSSSLLFPRRDLQRQTKKTQTELIRGRNRFNQECGWGETHLKIINVTVDISNLSVIISEFEGQRLNSPNDAVVRSDGSIYFYNSPWSDISPTGLEKNPD